MLRKKRKWNHIKCSLKTTKIAEKVEDKNRNKDNKQKTVPNMIDINPKI